MAKNNSNNRQRKWIKPSTRAEGYAEERKLGIHMRGDKKDEELDEYNKGLRSGYLLAQSDNAGMYKYKKALNEGKSPAEARKMIKERHKENGRNENSRRT